MAAFQPLVLGRGTTIVYSKHSHSRLPHFDYRLLLVVLFQADRSPRVPNLSPAFSGVCNAAYLAGGFLLQSPRPTGMPAKILIIEDSPDVREALKLLIEMEGYEVAVAMNGAEAREQATSEKPDLVLMDLVLQRT